MNIVLTGNGKNLSLSLRKVVWGVWRVATYPLALLAGYYFFGIDGVIYTALLLGLTNRGCL